MGGFAPGHQPAAPLLQARPRGTARPGGPEDSPRGRAVVGRPLDARSGRLQGGRLVRQLPLLHHARAGGARAVHFLRAVRELGRRVHRTAAMPARLLGAEDGRGVANGHQGTGGGLQKGRRRAAARQGAASDGEGRRGQAIRRAAHAGRDGLLLQARGPALRQGHDGGPAGILAQPSRPRQRSGKDAVGEIVPELQRAVCRREALPRGGGLDDGRAAACTPPAALPARRRQPV